MIKYTFGLTFTKLLSKLENEKKIGTCFNFLASSKGSTSDVRTVFQKIAALLPT